MIGKLTGLVDEIFEDFIILDVSGVGYKVSCTGTSLSRMHVGGKAKLYIEMVVREDQLSLYGFLDKDEQQWFNILQTVQGVGAKMAISILSHLSVNQIQSAIIASDQSAFKQVSGVGPKLASRLVNELASKKELFNFTAQSPTSGVQIKGRDLGAGNIANDALSALANLGFPRSDAYKIVSELVEANDTIALDDLLRLSLAKLASGK